MKWVQESLETLYPWSNRGKMSTALSESRLGKDDPRIDSKCRRGLLGKLRGWTLSRRWGVETTQSTVDYGSVKHEYTHRDRSDPPTSTQTGRASDGRRRCCPGPCGPGPFLRTRASTDSPGHSRIHTHSLQGSRTQGLERSVGKVLEDRGRSL